MAKRPYATGHDAPVTAEPIRFEQAIRKFRDRVPLTREEYDDLGADAEDFGFTVGGVAQADLVQQVFDAVDDAIESGETLDDFRDRVGDELYDAWGAEDASRLETIFRTNVNQAYNDGREAMFSQEHVADIRPIWRYELIDDDALCDICAPCEDVTLPADDPWWDENRPILHPNCRCSFTALTEEEAREEGFEGDEPDVEAADGFGGDRDEDYEPDLGDYADDVRSVLDRVLDR
jgi:SPP1 gp7 family putative phage head morphogenesis protein